MQNYGPSSRNFLFTVDRISWKKSVNAYGGVDPAATGGLGLGGEGRKKDKKSKKKKKKKKKKRGQWSSSSSSSSGESSSDFPVILEYFVNAQVLFFFSPCARMR